MNVGDALWWMAGAALSVGGLALTVGALFRDRARGRLRCPRCWYRMEGQDDRRCPECGRVARSERRLRRTRRHWGVAALGTLLVAGGLATIVTRQVQRHGWLGAVPNVVWVALLPHLDSAETAGELRRRVEAGDLRPWEYHLLVRRGLEILETPDDPPRVLLALFLFDRIENLGHGHETGALTRHWKSWARVSSIDGDRALRAMLDLLDHEDRSIRTTAENAIAAFRAAGRPAVPGLIGRLAPEDRLRSRRLEVVLVSMSFGAPDALDFPRGTLALPRPGDEIELREFFDRLRVCATDAKCALPVFTEGLASRDDRIRALSVYGAALFGHEDEAVRNRVLDLEPDRSPYVRRVVIQATSRFPLDERVEGLLREELGPYGRMPAEAALIVAAHGIGGATFLPEITARLHDGRPYPEVYVAIGGDGDTAVRAVLGDDPSALRPDILATRLREAAGLGVLAPGVGPDLEPLLGHVEPDVRAAAAFAVAMCGGDLAEPTRIVVTTYGKGWLDLESDLRRLIESRRLSLDVLRSLLLDPDPSNRAIAARALGQLGDASSLPRLRELRDDPDPIAAHDADQAVRTIEHRRSR